MPVDFLTEEEKQRYGRYVGDLSLEQLACYFYLSDSDRTIITEHRGDHNHLEFALQLVTLRFLGLFLSDPPTVSIGAVEYVAKQLSLSNVTCLPRYAERALTLR
ncbi:MAG TPA: DUF4158 domain-containing protein [Ktedonobacteraceae bacterium]|nr:DUF4158 domain-containing protein [Ktedonobacteraceae bacterium]